MATAIQVAATVPIRGGESESAVGIVSRRWTTLASLASSLPGSRTGAVLRGGGEFPTGGPAASGTRAEAGRVASAPRSDSLTGAGGRGSEIGRVFSKERWERQF
jgi:hypothetical protein